MPRHAKGMSRQMLGANGMMGDVFVEVGEAQKKLEHAIALRRIGFGGAFLEALHDSERIREQPFEALGVNRLAGATTLKGVVGALESLFEEMIEAKLLGREGTRDDVGTRSMLTGSG
jgi:hypothetical protein